MSLRYGVQYPDGGFTGPITDSKGLANAYASKHAAVVYDSQDPADPVYRAQLEAFGEDLA